MKKDKDQMLKQTLPGRLRARELGKSGGRPKKIDNDKIKLAENLYTCTNKPIVEICKELKISRPTYYAFLKEKGLQLKKDYTASYRLPMNKGDKNL